MTEAIIRKAVVQHFFQVADEYKLELPDMKKEDIMILIMKKMGINIYVDSPREGIYGFEDGLYCPISMNQDTLTTHDENGWTYPTWVGELLIHSRMSYNYSISNASDRVPARTPVSGEVEVSWGSPYIQYIGIANASQKLNDYIVESIHLFLHRHINCLLYAWNEYEEQGRKEWGRKQNQLLKEAGCDDKAIQAWWSLKWKKEYSPEEWADIVRNTSNMAVRYGLRAHAMWVIEELGLPTRNSFPRTKDMIRGLARAKKLTHIPKDKYREFVQQYQ